MLLVYLILNALAIWGFFAATRKEELFNLEMAPLPEWLAKPLYNCPFCMSSVWGLAGFAFFIIVVILDGRMSVYSDTVILGQVRFTPDFTIYNLPINVQIIEGLNSYTFNLYPFPNNVGDTINDVVIS
jgi:hypothetical protein